MTPAQALQILRDVVEQTNANALSHRTMAQALQTLQDAITAKPLV